MNRLIITNLTLIYNWIGYGAGAKCQEVDTGDKIHTYKVILDNKILSKCLDSGRQSACHHILHLNAGLSLVQADHVTKIQASDWPTVIIICTCS